MTANATNSVIPSLNRKKIQVGLLKALTVEKKQKKKKSK